MKLRYSYHSEPAARPRARWVHFLLFSGAFLLLVAAGQQFFLFFTDWHASDQEHSYWFLLLGIVYLLLGAVLAWWGYLLFKARRNDFERYVRIDDTSITWQLYQPDGVQRMALKDLVKAEQLNVRELQLTRTDGSTLVLPIYLVDGAAKQEELLATLRTVMAG
ncbi:hypothetical protein QWY85_19895 [Neolewinella lacunae]|uniref:Uncharacterized protein n=1 Tax=Neolewinella lacunae TaxID=1517758 RepID=A0A923PPS0_9BACT|nr:hypothetical protein [Neolewinella lacunae]MBC6996320.1 hypothetical protein [Neolewinella lacunae]MDN3636943.1 hypothetical protein [Neolewinella lacunae]